MTSSVIRVIIGSPPGGAAPNFAMERQPEVGGKTARNQKRNLGQMQDLAQGLATYLIVVTVLNHRDSCHRHSEDWAAAGKSSAAQASLRSMSLAQRRTSSDLGWT